MEVAGIQLTPEFQNTDILILLHVTDMHFILQIKDLWQLRCNSSLDDSISIYYTVH